MIDRQELIAIEVLGREVVGAVFYGIYGGRNIRGRRHHDSLAEPVVLLDDPEQLETADTGETDVEQDEMHVLAAQQLEGLFATVCKQYVVLGAERIR